MGPVDILPTVGSRLDMTRHPSVARGALTRSARLPSKFRFFAGVLRLGVAVSVTAAAADGTSHAAERSPAGAGGPEYNADIRPILAEHCFACHGADSGSREAGLRLDVRDEAIEAGAIVPGDPGASEMLARVLSDDPDLVMPPPETDKPLSDTQREILRRWLAAGAEYETHWAFSPPRRVAAPEVSDAAWVKGPIDRFVLAELEKRGLAPAPEAEPRELFRRLHLDVTGLPPAPEETEAFVDEYAASGDAALSAWIDRLMDRPTWGEHRGRYWLDAARYADTHGLHFDNYREMWPYRDWVIRAFNRNQPFDQFTIEQIAGDLLPEPSESQLVATGFQRCNITTNEGGTIDEENLALYAADRVQTFGWVYLGLTTNCAQCHDHKFDPISIRDYYALAAYFRNTTQGPKDGNVKDGRGPVITIPSDQDRPRWEALPTEIADAKRRRDEYREAAKPAWRAWLEGLTVERWDSRMPADDLLIHLPLDEGQGGEVQGIRGHGAEASQVRYAAAAEPEWLTDGKRGAAPVVRAGQTWELGDLGDFERTQPFTVGLWVRPANQSASAAIVARMDEAASHRGWDLWQNGQSYAVHLIDRWPENAIKVITRDAVVKPGQWQHVMVTYDGSGKASGIRIYVDGKPQPHRADRDQLADDASIRTSTPLRIGQRSGGAVFDGGGVQDLRMFARGLADDEIRSLAEGPAIREILATPPEKRTPQQDDRLFEIYLSSDDPEYPELVETVARLEGEFQAIRDRSPVTHIQRERDEYPPKTHILIRGEYDQLGEEVIAATPATLHPLPEDAPNNRLGLARWLIDPANPLTARVTVNRFWQQLFGRGLVETSEDFGVMGTPPSHPELLDWLALEFQEDGWDVKRFFKRVLSSATYRQAAIVTPDKLERDRENIWLSRGPRFRMDAEMLRDSALAVSGLLSSKMFGPGVKPYQPEAIWDIVGLPGGNTRDYVQDQGEDVYRRTLYSFWKRMAPPPSLETFNATSREVCTVRRERTNTPLQALVTLNDPQFFEAARALAERVREGHDDLSDDALIERIARLVLARPLSDLESELVREDLAAYREHYRLHGDDALALLAVGDRPARTDGVSDAELAAWTMVCNQLLNLDETLCK